MAFSLKGAYYLYCEKHWKSREWFQREAKTHGMNSEYGRLTYLYSQGGDPEMQSTVRTILAAAANDPSTRLVRVRRGIYRMKPLQGA